MKKINYTWLIVLFVIVATAVSCSSERRVSGKNCGCGVHKGYVGY